MVEGEGRFPGVYKLVVDGEERLATINLAPGVQVYGERLVKGEGVEYRLWDPYRSKLAAAMIKGMKRMPITEKSRVLYLGASTGTTASHVSDITKEGVVFCVEVSPRVARELMEKCATHRKNVVPIIKDARNPQEYYSIHGDVDVVYCDIAQPDQTEIAVLNSKHFLKGGGHLLLIVKSRSIDVTKKPSKVFREEEEKLKSSGFTIDEVMDLEPFDKDHILIHATLAKK